jgi:hypothetical protein
MRTLSLRALCLLLVLATQTFAQRFTATRVDSLHTGLDAAIGGVDYGYFPRTQSAVLGEKNSSYSDLMLFHGRDTTKEAESSARHSYKVVNSYGKEFGDIYPIPLSSQLYKFVNSLGDTIYDNAIGGAVVLDSFSDNKKTATVLFATLRLLIVAELKINNFGSVEHSILKRFEMPLQVSQAHDSYNFLPSQHRRLTLLGTSKDGSDKVYHIATGNPYYKSETYSMSGRIDFFSLRENLWILTQPNNKGIVSGDGLFFTQGTAFGLDLVSVGDLDGNGYNELAVLLPASNQFPNSAMYIFFMDNEYTPSSKSPVIITGSSMPWKEPAHNGLNQNCNGISFATWKQEQHLLLSCTAGAKDSTIAFIKDITLGSDGNILHTSILSSEKQRNSYSNLSPYSNPVTIKNPENENPAIALPIREPCD